MTLHHNTLTIKRSWQDVRGKLTPMANIGKFTWFGVGGPAEWLFEPADTEDLIHFLKNCPREIPINILGAGSNTLVRDGGVKGVTIRLSGFFKQINFKQPHNIIVGAGARDAEVARFAAKNEISGLEFLIGIPGTIGGGITMNAGANGIEFKDILKKVSAIDRNGVEHHIFAKDLKMEYRQTKIPKNWIFTHAEFSGSKGDAATIRKKFKNYLKHRAEAQPVGKRTGGSTFANPKGHKAWKLIDEAGCRGLAVGKAQVSEKHCNFLINNGGATATEIEKLALTILRRVKQQSGLKLRWEIKRIGQSNKINKEQAK